MTRIQATRAFSKSASVWGSGEGDVALSTKFQSELQYENDGETPGEPEFLTAFKEQSSWEIEDIAGHDEVTLTRTFGNETLRLMFAVADISPDEKDFENEEEMDMENNPTYPIRASLAVTKNNTQGALNIDMVVQEGQFLVDNISFYKDSQLGTELTAEADWNRRGLYIGPQFDTLDLTLQEEFDKWLRERGVNETVAMFIPEYAEHKEQKEYIHWLKNVKSFIDQ
ncbi:mitochondrial glyco protein [Pluteus cervinus]|uniref:Mitochondrial glyco protein n=1 Tax=Pluteus cervinus TaxID=181527 RepID=A0ACD3B615_9AGAR|nr:mitochondrial glyco protein [Pluteus cervinus]